MNSYYFAYGSNMNPERMRTRGLAFDLAVPATLAQAELLFNKRAADAPHRSYANIGFRQGSVVEGVAYRLLDEHQIVKMDPFEGAPRLYSRDIFTVHSSDGPINAWVYVANKAMIQEDLKPARWYLEHLLAGQEFLSEAYFQRLCQVECVAE
ncbi:gamma-glutamylcyclotransferase family protein [Pseudoteredinibacter isoporae]|uniref:gamma-glutamylcyclotransferase family protein n=1 Tax=Pseudoteredinibacter isoporae TaxID=570281 RepID=UPI00310944C3